MAATADRPDWQVFDRAALVRQRQRAAARFGAHDFLHREVGERLLDRLADINRSFEAGVDLGGNLARLGLLPAAGQWHVCTEGVPLSGAHAIEAETLPAEPGSADLVVSNLYLHSVNDLPGMLAQARTALRPDGLFLAALFGGHTLTELRHAFLEAEAEITGGASPRVSPFADVRDAGGLLQRAGFALPVADADVITVEYESPLRLMADLRGMGEANALADRSRKTLRRDVLARMLDIYMGRHATPSGRVQATFEIVWLTGWHPHESQQKPLRRGSGSMPLGDALKAAMDKPKS